MIHTQVQPSASTEKSRMTWHYLDSNFKVRYLLRDNTEKYILSFSPPFFKRGFHFWNSFPMHPTTFPLNLLNTFCSEKQMAKKKKKKKKPHQILSTNKPTAIRYISHIHSPFPSEEISNVCIA